MAYIYIDISQHLDDLDIEDIIEYIQLNAKPDERQSIRDYLNSIDSNDVLYGLLRELNTFGVKDFLIKFIKETSKIAEYTNEAHLAETIVNKFIEGLEWKH